ncbi:hypothetical protein XENE109146_17350 [Xenorhabdus nematophila]
MSHFFAGDKEDDYTLACNPSGANYDDFFCELLGRVDVLYSSFTRATWVTI